MCVLLNRVSAVLGASVIALAGCQSMGGTQSPPVSANDVPVPADTQLIVLAYDKNVSPGNLTLTNVPDNVKVIFVVDTSSGGYPDAKDKNGKIVDKCEHCTLQDIKNGKCDKVSKPKLCDAFNHGDPKRTVVEHFDIYTSFGSCTKQVCPFPGWCYTIIC